MAKNKKSKKTAKKDKKAKKHKPDKKKKLVETAVDAREVMSDLARLARLMRSAEHEIGLNPAQWEALRYLSRCNDVSNSPIALTRYLGATKGTISQTVIALVKKGLVEKSNREGERRSVVLTLTDAGRDFLKEDPWLRVENAFAEMGAKNQSHTAKTLAGLLDKELESRRAQGMSAWPSSAFFATSK